jgi:hypothetical protein
MRKIVMAVCIIGAALMGTGSAAHAAPPSNDDISNAVVVTGDVFSHDVDNSEATYDADDPQECGVATVWYEYTPAESGTASVFAYGFEEPPKVVGARGGDLSEAICSETNSLAVAVTAGETYLFSVGTQAPGVPGQVGPGSFIQFYLSFTPPQLTTVDVAFDPEASLSRRGVVTLTGTVTCDQPGSATINLTVTQLQGETLVTAPGSVETACDPEGTRWAMQATPAAGSRFRPGRVLTGGDVMAWGSRGGADWEPYLLADVQLRRRG